MMDHQVYMSRCIELAELGAGSVSPNPMVGSVIVSEGKIIGEGYHQRIGEAHAEVNAVKAVLEKYGDAETILQNSTLYVCLEPCSHFGKTPPCADLIIRHKIPKVIIGCRDPFSHVNGSGIQKLKDAGIEVVERVLKDECEGLNKRFFTRVKKQRPYIILKWAQTADGYFAPADGSQKWITSPLSKSLAHRWRSEEDAVMVGKNTALADNPQLNVREWTGKNPIRIVIDRRLELPLTLHVFDQSSPTIIFNESKTAFEGTIKYLELEDFDHYLPQLIAYQLYLLDVQSIIIEGGAKMLELFIKAGLWDEARIFTGDVKWGNGVLAPVVNGKVITNTTLGADQLEIMRNS